MRIHWIQVEAFLQKGSATNRDRRLSGHMNHAFWQLMRKVGCKRQEISRLSCSGLSRSGPIFKVSRLSWKIHIFHEFPKDVLTKLKWFCFFISGSRSFLDGMILLFTKMSQEKKKNSSQSDFFLLLQSVIGCQDAWGEVCGNGNYLITAS